MTNIGPCLPRHWSGAASEMDQRTLDDMYRPDSRQDLAARQTAVDLAAHFTLLLRLPRRSRLRGLVRWIQRRSRHIGGLHDGVCLGRCDVEFGQWPALLSRLAAATFTSAAVGRKRAA